MERREQEIESLSDDNERLQREVDNLRHQLIEQKEQQLDKEPPAPVMAEIHNHFESGCSAQVFNDKVKAKITKSQIRRWKKRKNQKA